MRNDQENKGSRREQRDRRTGRARRIHRGPRDRGVPGARRLLAGATAARTGDEMSGPALLLLGYGAGGSVTTAAALLAGITAAAAVGGPVLGALLDRTARPGRLLGGSLVLYAAGLTAVLLSLGRVPFPLTLLLALAAGTLAPALAGGWTAQLSTAVPAEALHRAHALDAMTFSAASLLGPALAGLLGRHLGAPAAVAASAALILLAVPATRGLPRRPGDGARPTPRAVTADLVRGFACLTRCVPLARAAVTSTLSSLGQGLFVACVPLLGAGVLGTPGDGVLLLGCVALAALAAGAVLARRRRAPDPDTVLWVAPLVLAAAFAAACAAAATGRADVLVAAALLVGAAEGPQLTALFAMRHREAPERLRAQVFTTGASVKITAFALGAAVGGSVAERSLPGALLAAAAVQLSAAAAYPLVGAPRPGRPSGRGRAQ
ncbi:MFS transporter [Streptomyces sp. NPDC126499]|uniref:MFS transporter n=1 Tax=Streptomyces sp. NPDC126499 TaxID=3155314 RepID=UPI00332A13DA